MANLTANRNTREYLGKTFVGEAGATIYEGALIAMNSSGKVIPAATTASAAGVALEGAASGEKLSIAVAGIYGFDNSTAAAVGVKDLGNTCYVADDHTVAISGSTATAGKVVGIDGDQVLVKI